MVKGQLQAMQLQDVLGHFSHLLEEQQKEWTNLELCVLELIYELKSRHFEPKKERLKLNLVNFRSFPPCVVPLKPGLSMCS